MSLLVGAISAAGMFCASVILLRWLDAQRLRQGENRYLLHFPWGLEPAAVRALVAGLSGIRAPRWQRLIAMRAVIFETVASSAGIRHYLVLPRALEGVVMTHMRAAIPGARVDREEGEPEPRQRAIELTISSIDRPLRVEAAVETSTAVLASVQPLAKDEGLTLQWVLSPGPLQPVPAQAQSAEGQPLPWRLLRWLHAGPAVDSEGARQLAAKQSEPLVLASGRIGASGPSRVRERQLLQQVLSAFHLANAPGVHLRRRVFPPGWASRRLNERTWPLVAWPCLLNALETASVLGFPLGEPVLPGLSLASRQLPPPSDVPAQGSILASSTYPGPSRAIAISPSDRLRHLHVIGPTGVGKSTLLLNLIAQDLQAGHGVVVLDPKGDLINDALEVIPAERVPHVIVLDPNDSERPVCFNPLRVRREDRELMADQVTSIFATLFREFWGPRTDDILRAALLTLAAEPGMTLCEIVLLLNDIQFRRRLVARVRDPILGSFWSWYEQLAPGERSMAIGPVMNKLRAFLLRRKIRNVLGVANPPLDFDQVLAQQQVLLVPLSKGLLGEESSSLLGSLVLSQLWQATLGRAAITPAERNPIMVHVDEFQDFFSLPTSIGDMLVQARSFGLGLTLAHQHMGQLPNQMRQGILANARTKVVFQTTADDARLLAREFEPLLSPADLQSLGAFEVAIRAMRDGRVSGPYTGVTLPPPLRTRFAHHVRDWSRQRYGLPRAEIEAAIRARQERGGRGEAIGRKPRRP